MRMKRSTFLVIVIFMMILWCVAVYFLLFGSTSSKRHSVVRWAITSEVEGEGQEFIESSNGKNSYADYLMHKYGISEKDLRGIDPELFIHENNLYSRDYDAPYAKRLLEEKTHELECRGYELND